MSKEVLNTSQKDAVRKMQNGCILNGGVGSGKSRVALAYYLDKYSDYIPPKQLYIITTARKRDTDDWKEELKAFDVEINMVIDSWNNIKKYASVTKSFFIFDEQRVCGSGVWVKAFLQITKSNDWILLSATPGDTWMDYIPVFIANGFYKNRTDFIRQHVIYSRFAKFPKVDRYIGQGKLQRYRNRILVDMDVHREAIQHHEDIEVSYDIYEYKKAYRTRWNAEKGCPITSAAELCSVLRKIVVTDKSRKLAVLELVHDHPRVIIFYNFDYELEILRGLNYGKSFKIAEWNGHNHDPIPESKKWVYLVQYSACEGWNCISTDTIIFYSQNYSYKVLIQASGRIDRMNTPYKDLYYYHLKSKAPIDIAIGRAIKNKKNFNEKRFVGDWQ